IIQRFTPPNKERYGELMEYLSRSPILLFGPGIQKIKETIKLAVTDIETLMLKTNTILKNKIEDRNVINAIRSLNLESLREYERKLTPLPEGILESKELKSIYQGLLFTIEEVLVFNKISSSKQTIRWKISKKLKKIIEQSTFILPAIYNNKTLFNFLYRNNLTTLYELLVYCNSTNDSEIKNYCSQLLEEVDFTTIEQYTKDAKSALITFVKEEQLINELKKKGINSIGELIYLFQKQYIQDFSPKMKEILSLLRAPLSLLIPQKTVLRKLVKEGIEQISDMVLLKDISALPITITEKQQKEMADLLTQLSLPYIRTKLEETSYRIKDVGLFNDTEKQALESAGYTHITHLSLSETRASEQSSFTPKQFRQFKELLDSPIYDLLTLIRDNPNSVFNLYSKNISSLWDLFSIPPGTLAEITKIPERQFLSYFTTLTPQSLKIGKKERVKLIQTTPYLSSELIEELKEKGISTFQELLFVTASQKSSSVYKKEEIKNLLTILNRPIEDLDIEKEVIDKIKALGIKRIKEFIIYPTSVLEGKTGQTYAKIRKIKQSLPIAKKTKQKTTTKKPSTAKKPTTSKPSTAKKPTTSKPSTAKKPTTSKPSTAKKPTASKTRSKSTKTSGTKTSQTKGTTSRKQKQTTLNMSLAKSKSTPSKSSRASTKKK
ncbi:MAG: hypothetical protein ACTSPI_14025, partial [Candidatus Heimdallarchaeaceae archaeon]